MNVVADHRVRIGLFLLLVSIVLCSTPLGQAAPPAQRSDGLDTPLLAANRCGTGAADDVHFTFAATGDTFPHENIQAVGEAQGYDYIFDHVRPFLQAADIGYTNFDGAMLAGSPFSGYPTFNYNPALAPALKNAGIDLVSTANNHILDRGPEGIDATLTVLQEAGIAQHGTVPSSASAQPRPLYLPITLSRDGVSITIGFLSFTWGTNGIPDPFGQVNLLWESNEYGQQGNIRQSVLDAIAQAQRETDLVIVAAHWGYEYQFYPDASQIAAAQQMAAAGADLILGAQSHTLQPVDIITTGERTTLVIYSLANFLASQGAFQSQFFSATSVIFYAGIVRQADGTVRISGYRYLPTIHIDNDTRPAPIPAQDYAPVLDHVRLMMRDPGGLRQLSPDPSGLGERVEVCPAYSLAPSQQIGGDFAQYVTTLGNGTTPRAPNEILAVFGYPLGTVVQEPTGDCQGRTHVLYTERQRLEWQPQADWPGRVVGTQLGTAVYQRRYGLSAVQRRTDLDADAFADERFRAFYQAYGGLPIFGYPISEALRETDPTTGQAQLVQYFERARFELVPAALATGDLLGQVRLGLLGREYAGIASQCGSPVAAAPQGSSAPANPTLQAAPQSTLQPAPELAAPPVAVLPPATHGWQGWAVAGLSGLLLLLLGLTWLDYQRPFLPGPRLWVSGKRKQKHRKQ